VSRPFTLASLFLAMAAALVHADSPVVGTEFRDELVVPASFEGPPQDYVNLDQIAGYAEAGEAIPDVWTWQVLPEGLVYENYLAGTKESRLSFNYFKEEDLDWLVDGTVDVEGAAQLRLDPEENMDLHSADFRCGVPFTYGVGRSRWKFGYYHTSAHLGDEFLLRNPGFTRLNFSRDVLILGYAFYATPRIRLYGETGWAFYSDISEPWEFQFGIDSAPAAPTGPFGAPFWAVNGHLRQEVDFSGSITAQAGWAWRSDVCSPLLRAGFHYFNGKSNQYSFYNEHEQQLGMAVWYDF
jgi:hypothetical protein